MLLGEYHCILLTEMEPGCILCISSAEALLCSDWRDGAYLALVSASRTDLFAPVFQSVWPAIDSHQVRTFVGHSGALSDSRSLDMPTVRSSGVQKTSTEDLQRDKLIELLEWRQIPKVNSYF